MGFKNYLVDFWEENIIEGTNRKALKRIMKASELWHTQNRLLQLYGMLIHNRNIRKYHCEIYPQAKLGKGLYIPHCVGIVVGSTTELGENCILYPNVVFGAKHNPGEGAITGRRHAKVGDNCSFGANASIIGNITIGNNVTVGAGAVITKDIPDNAIVVGVNEIIGYRE